MSNTIYNSDGRTINISTQTSAIRIDDNDVSVRKTWSSAKISQGKADSEASKIAQFTEKYGGLFLIDYEPSVRDDWEAVIQDAAKALEDGQSFCVPWNGNRIAQVVSADPDSDTPLVAFIDGLAYKITEDGLEETVLSPLVGKVRVGTKLDWQENPMYVPEKGEIIIYSDQTVIDGVEYPGIKVGDGKAYVVDLPFVADASAQDITKELREHIQDSVAHVTQEDRNFWNNKLNCELVGDELIFNRQ